VKLVLDTNVLIAALVARATCSDLLEHCVRQHMIVSSQSLLNELHEVLEKKFSQRAIDVRAALQLFAETFMLVKPDPLDPPVCRDRDDDVVLATALAGECAAIITRDQDLLILNPYRGIHVLAPSAFWKWESEHG
jgi:putative PIN family toxin of toxin-antitoxin system